MQAIVPEVICYPQHLPALHDGGDAYCYASAGPGAAARTDAESIGGLSSNGAESSAKLFRSIYQTLSLVEVGMYVYASASIPPLYFHEIGAKTVRRWAASQQVLTRYKLL